MTGLWREPGVPHKNWKCVDFYDLKDSQGPDFSLQLCEMCQVSKIRYVHVLRHKYYPNALCVGSTCAEKLEDDSTRPKKRESILKRRKELKRKWSSLNWKKAGGTEEVTFKWFRALLYPKEGYCDLPLVLWTRH